MTDKLPPNLLALFAARPPLRWLEFPDYAPEKRQTPSVGGVAAFLPELQKYKDADGYQPTESWVQARERKKREKKEATEELRREGPKTCEFYLAWHFIICQLTAFIFLQINQMRTPTSAETPSKR
jgi:U1 small nuclear ribonucleoprotein